MTDALASKIKTWIDTHYPIHIPIAFMIFGIVLTMWLNNVWLQPEREAELKQVCPTMSEECLNRLTWEPSPLLFFIPFSCIAAGFMVGNAVRSNE